jgi:drug/metabolite transporter (DMT)-like permease
VVLAAPGSGSTGSLTAVLACLLAPVCFAASYVYADRFLTSRESSPLTVAAAQLSAGAMLAGLLLPAIGRRPPTFTPLVVLGIAVVGLFSTGAAYVLNYRLIQDEGATIASAASYLVPAVAVTLGLAVSREPMTWNLVTGALTVLAGVAILQRQRPSRQP